MTFFFLLLLSSPHSHHKIKDPDDDPNDPNNKSKQPKFSNDFRKSAALTGAYLPIGKDKENDKGKARDSGAKKGSDASDVPLLPILSARSGNGNGGSTDRAAQLQQVLLAQQQAFAEQLNQETERLRAQYLRRLQDTIVDFEQQQASTTQSSNKHTIQLGD